MTAAIYPYECVTEIPEIQFEEFDGAKFAYIKWPSNTDVAKARVLIVHGFCEHCKLQYRLMDNLALNGFESFMFDQRGSGMTSPGKLRGMTDEHHTFKDLDHFVEKNSRECKDQGIPLILFGHSMGGAIVLNYAVHGKSRDKIDAYSCTGPLILLHPHSRPNRVTTLLAPLLAKCLPNHRIDTELDLEGITCDKRYRDFLVNDQPLSTPIVGSLRQIYDFLKRGESLYYNRENSISDNFVKDKPVLVMHGQDDTINDPDASKHFVEKVCPATDKTLKLYPGARHSILSLETDATFSNVFNDYVEWLNRVSR